MHPATSGVAPSQGQTTPSAEDLRDVFRCVLGERRRVPLRLLRDLGSSDPGCPSEDVLGTMMTSASEALHLDAHQHVDYEQLLHWAFGSFPPQSGLDPSEAGRAAGPARAREVLPEADNSLGHELRGVSVHYIATSLLDEVGTAGFSRDASVYDIEERVIRGRGASIVCPRDGRLGAAYVDCINGPDGAGLATVMLSYCWAYKIHEIAETLQNYCVSAELDPKRTYVWICCLCINQHRVRESSKLGHSVPFEEFRRIFADRVHNIGHVMAMLAPWRQPMYTRRVWCCYEMFTCISQTNQGCSFVMVMPPSEAESFRAALLNGARVDEVFKALASLRVELAEASVSSDRDKIIKLIEDGPGFAKINAALVKQLQTWLVQASDGYLRQKDGAWHSGSRQDMAERAKLCARVGPLLLKVGLVADACHRLQEARELYEHLGILSTPEGASLLRSLGAVKQSTGDLDGALSDYESARLVRQWSDTLNSSSGAKLLQNLGGLQRHRGDLPGAKAVLEEARLIHEQHGTLSSPSGADLLKDLGIVTGQCGDLDGELAFFDQARDIRQKTGSLETPEGAELLSNIGLVQKLRGHNIVALESYNSAKLIQKRTGTVGSPSGASLLKNIGSLKRDQGQLDEAVEAYSKALAIRKATGTLETTQGANLLVSMGDAKGERGDIEGQIEAYEEALAIRKAVRALETPGGAKVIVAIAAAKLRRQRDGDVQQALSSFQEARRIMERTGTIDAVPGAELLASLGSAQLDLGDHASASLSFRDALAVRERTQTLATPGGRDLLARIGSREELSELSNGTLSIEVNDVV